MKSPCKKDVGAVCCHITVKYYNFSAGSFKNVTFGQILEIFVNFQGLDMTNDAYATKNNSVKPYEMSI